jgi:hypothetical protein
MAVRRESLTNVFHYPGIGYHSDARGSIEPR